MKSILVIDTPNSCGTCPLSYYNEYYREYFCRGREYYRTIEDYEWQSKQMCGKDTKPEWCPLSPLPQKKELQHYIQRGDAKSMTHTMMYMHDQGWNDCIDEIMKSEDKKC